MIIAEVSEELSILPKKFGNLVIGFILINFQNFLVFKKAALSNKDLKIIIHGIDHQLPIDCVQHVSLSIENLVIGVPSFNHPVERFSSRIFDLMIFARNHQANKRNEDGIIFFIHSGGIKVHQLHCMVDGLVVRLEAIGDVAEVINPFNTFLYKSKVSKFQF